MAEFSDADFLKAFKRLRDAAKLRTFKPYDWQKKFFDAGKENSERLLMAANGVGKTICGGVETAYHLTGDYPDWWDGRRFSEPVTVWVGSITNMTQRDYIQPILLGPNLGDGLGGGFIPKDRIVGKVRTRQAGIPDVADIVSVRHRSGGTSRVVFKTYEQGWRMWQGAAPQAVWMDEQQDESASNEKRIFSEAQTRVFRSSGILYVTLTPLLGETEMISHFLNPKAPGIWWCGATWDQAPHLSDEDKKRLRASYPEHEVAVRTMGVPIMGEGRVFTTPEDEIRISPFEPTSSMAVIKGIDFGIGHPAAVADVGIDFDQDIIYVMRTWKKSNAEIEEHAEAINQTHRWAPVAWPHDGNNRVRGKQGNERLKDLYVKCGVRMLSRSARYKNDTGGGQAVEPIVQEIETRARTGGFKVFSTCEEFFDEYRNYHRKDGKIVPIRDDVLKAVFYAVMMKRFARRQNVVRAYRPQAPVVTARL